MIVPKLVSMQVSGNTSVQQVLRAYQTSQTAQVETQVALLKKTLDSQKEEAANLLKLIEGKGQNVDIRV